MTQLIIAIDTNSYDNLLDYTKMFEGIENITLKLGLEYLLTHGVASLITITSRIPSVMIDVKLADIPETDLKATRTILEYTQPELLTVSTMGAGLQGIAAVRKVIDDMGLPTKVLAITVLTSMGISNLADLLPGGDEVARRYLETFGGMEGVVKHLARKAKEAGAHGVVCSAHEARRMREILGPEATIVCPGIRLSGGETNDQKRVATPTFAAREGASHIVVGRPILQAEDPLEVTRAILKELEDARTHA